MVKELSVLQGLDSIIGQGSQKRKMDLIRSNYSEKMEYLLDVCYNPFVTTKINHLLLGAVPQYPESQEIWKDFQILIEALKNSPAANNNLRKKAQDLVNTRLVEDNVEDYMLRSCLSKIITKKLNIGIGAKLVNKSIGKEVIPDPSLMLATDKQEEISKWGRIFCEEKYDGVRIIALWKDGDFKYFTRAFRELDSSYFEEISKNLKICLEKSSLKGSWFFDGELTDFNRKSVSGKVTQILKGSPKKEVSKDFVFNVFDLEETDTLRRGSGVLDYVIRRETLEGVIGYLPEECNQISLASMTEVENSDQINEIYKKIVRLGGEGVICKNDGIYETKRSKNWIKIKEVNECDLLVEGWYPGEGKREGYIGGLVCTDKSNTVHVKVGSGFSDLDLENLSKSPDDLIGSVISVQYNVPITDKKENRSLFLPRFVEVRLDKNDPDDLSNLF